MAVREENVFTLLDNVRERPDTYLRNRSTHELETLLHGYYSGLRMHQIVEPVPQMNMHFLDWLRYRTEWPLSCGWAVAIERIHPKADAALSVFFSLVDEYRQLRPTSLCTVKLSSSNNPTGKSYCVGMNGRMEKPRHVEIVRYRPEPLHFLRFHFGDRVENGDLIMTNAGGHATSVRLAKEWVRDEFQVEPKAWKKV